MVLLLFCRLFSFSMLFLFSIVTFHRFISFIGLAVCGHWFAGPTRLSGEEFFFAKVKVYNRRYVRIQLVSMRSFICDDIHLTSLKMLMQCPIGRRNVIGRSIWTMDNSRYDVVANFMNGISHNGVPYSPKRKDWPKINSCQKFQLN